MSRRMEIARDGWNGDVPDWILALVAACDARGASQNKVARKVGVSATLISQAISNRYSAPLGNMEARVRATLMSHAITCPPLGEISTADCLGHRDRSGKLTSAAPMTVRMFRACRACPLNPRSQDDE